MNIFEYAVRNKLRFASVRGALTVEQLWDVPLRSKDDFNLNAIAKSANGVVKSLGEENFVDEKHSPQLIAAEIALDVVKSVIQTRLDEETLAKKRAADKEELGKLLNILAEKQEGKLSELSEAELKKRIKALSASASV